MTGFPVLALALSALSCSDDEEGVRELASKVDITLGSWCGLDGKTVAPAWTDSDRGVLAMQADGMLRVSEASPLQTGSSRSLFLFTIDATTEKADVFSWYPADAEMSVSGTALMYEVPEIQTGEWTPPMVGTDYANVNSYGGCTFALTPVAGTLIVPVAMGDYEVAEMTVTARGGEKIAGQVTADLAAGTFSASSPAVTMRLPEAVSCRGGSVSVPVYCSPAELSEGIDVQIVTSSGETIKSSLTGSVSIAAGGMTVSGKAAEGASTELVFCGDNMVYVINADLAKDSYRDAVIWSMDVKTLATVLGIDEAKCDHLDDCKFVDGGRKLLLTASRGWCALIDYATSEVLFHTTQAANAHSAEYIEGGYIAVACSDGSTANHNQVQLYDISRSETILSRGTLPLAHGVVWDSERGLLYAAGGNRLQTWAIDGMDTGEPSLTLKSTVQTPKGNVHDLSYVDANTLCVAGISAYLYGIGTGTFEEMTHFSASTALKSVNFNPETGEFWYTDATVPEGNETWSSQKIRYGMGKNSSQTLRIISVPDMDMYKVRVKNW